MSPRLTQIISELPIVNHDITFSYLVHIGRSDMKFSAVRDSISYISDIIKDNPDLSQMTINNYLKYGIPPRYFRGGNTSAYRSDSE